MHTLRCTHMNLVIKHSADWSGEAIVTIPHGPDRMLTDFTMPADHLSRGIASTPVLAFLRAEPEYACRAIMLAAAERTRSQFMRAMEEFR